MIDIDTSSPHGVHESDVQDESVGHHSVARTDVGTAGVQGTAVAGKDLRTLGAPTTNNGGDGATPRTWRALAPLAARVFRGRHRAVCATERLDEPRETSVHSEPERRVETATDSQTPVSKRRWCRNRRVSNTCRSRECPGPGSTGRSWGSRTLPVLRSCRAFPRSSCSSRAPNRHNRR